VLSRLGAFVGAARCKHAVLHTSSAMEGGVKILVHVSHPLDLSTLELIARALNLSEKWPYV